MAVSITIRNVPDETRDELASRAALKGQSMQEYLHARLLEMTGKPDAAAWVAQVRADKAAARSLLTTEQILELRDLGRR